MKLHKIALFGALMLTLFCCNRGARTIDRQDEAVAVEQTEPADVEKATTDTDAKVEKVERIEYEKPDQIEGSSRMGQDWKTRYYNPPQDGEIELPGGFSWTDANGENSVLFTTTFTKDGAECFCDENCDWFKCCGDALELNVYQLRRKSEAKAWTVINETGAYIDSAFECSSPRWLISTGTWSVSDLDQDGVGEATFVFAGGTGEISIVQGMMFKRHAVLQARRSREPGSDIHFQHLKHALNETPLIVGEPFPEK